ncbi:MAG: hypothetical protein KatS3mg015_0119 [Fimbriimonadales bacterium]|nr:MAG: hypothetical protein KatS3mg015_0119 [Fimbriimonadales bacterium]
MKTWMHAVLAAGASLVAGFATPQSFNVDLDGLFFPGPPSPTGVPRPSFGAAAEQPGLWNQVYILARGPIPLQDASGRWTGVTFSAWGGVGSGGGWANPRWSLGEVNDDFWLLMGDAADINPPFAPHQIMPPDPLIVYTFDGLQPGVYDAFTYGVIPADPPRTAPVYVTCAWRGDPEPPGVHRANAAGLAIQNRRYTHAPPRCCSHGSTADPCYDRSQQVGVDQWIPDRQGEVGGRQETISAVLEAAEKQHNTT